MCMPWAKTNQALCENQISNLLNGLTQAYFLSSSWQIKYKAHVLKTRNNYKLVTDTPVYVQAVKSGKQLSDVSAHWRSYFRESKTGPPH